MQTNQNISIPQSGMIRDKHPGSLTEQEYTFALNANIEGEDGNVMLRQNEPSNIKCIDFSGYKVCGYRNDVESNYTYFFLTNPDDKTSKIVYLDSNEYANSIADIQIGSGFDVRRILGSPMEESGDRYESTCGTYGILIEDDASDPCLRFSLAHPIKTIEFKTEKCGRRIYFTDNYNPPRYVDIVKALEPDEDGDIWYHYHGYKTCGDDSPLDRCTIACEKLRVFPLIDTPCIDPETIEYGGNLPGGVYQFCIASCDQFGNESSIYHSLTNPIHIWDRGDILIKDGRWGGRTNCGIKLAIRNLDPQTSHYKIGVIQNTVGYDGASQPSLKFKIEGVHPITEKTVYYFTDLDAEDTTLSHLAAQHPVYNTAKGMTQVSNRLLMYGLTQEPEWNLQPVCSLLGHFMEWQTSFASEKLYEDGMACSKYAGYMRDEVYPFAICFTCSNGYKTPKFPLIPRPASKSELEEVDEDNLERRSISQYVPICSGNERIKRWQLENTAINLSRRTRSDEEECKNEVEYNRSVIVTKDIFTYSKGGRDIVLTFPTDMSIPESEILTWVETHLESICDDPQGVDAETLCRMMAEEDNIPAPEIPDGCDRVERDRSKDVTYMPRDLIEDAEYDYEYVPLDEMRKAPSSDFSIPSNSTGDTNTTINIMFPSEQDVYDSSGNKISKYRNVQDYIEEVMMEPCQEYLEGEHDWDYSTYNAMTDLAESRFIGPSIECTTGCSPSDAIDNPVFNADSPYAVALSRVTGPVIHSGDTEVKRDHTDKGIREKNKDFLTGENDLDKWKPHFMKLSQSLTWNENGSGSSFDTGIGSGPSGRYGDSNLDYYRVMNPNGEGYTGFAASTAVAYKFNRYVSKTAKWFKISRPDNPEDTIYLELYGNSSAPDSSGSQDSTICKYVRCSFFSDQNGTAFKNPFSDASRAVASSNNSVAFRYNNGLYERRVLTYDDFGGHTELYVAIDSMMCILGNIVFPNSCKHWLYAFGVVMTAILPSYIGFGIREKDVKALELTCKSITVRRDGYFVLTCTSCGDRPIQCDPRRYEYGIFSYWESLEKYPANFELYDSSRVRISNENMTEDKQAFLLGLESYYGSPKEDSRGYYFDEGNNAEYPEASAIFCQKNIRHYKFPDNKISPFMGDNTIPGSDEVYIYPIGIRLEEKYVNGALDAAVDTGLITQEQRDLVNGFEIYRGDRRLNKSVIGAGLGFDMYKYEDDFGKESYFSNFPYNQLGYNKYLYTDGNRSNYINHPFNSEKNNKFTFSSPDYSFNKPDLPTELRIEGYQMGTTEGLFDDVQDYSRYVVLGYQSKAYAKKMATLEAMMETWSLISTKALEALGNGGGGLIGGIVGLFAKVAQAAIAITHIALGYIERYNRYRDDWLNILETKGIPKNMASYYSSVGRYNIFIPSTDSGQDLRGIRMSKYLTPGMLSLVPPGSGDNVNINNRDRESSIFLDLGDEDFCVRYPNIYKDYDNSRVIENETALPDVISGPLRRRGTVFAFAASPYFKAKQYNPSQYGGLENINWLNVGHCGKFGNYEDGIIDLFGGDIFISRFSLKRKFRFFHTDAFRIADLTPFAHNDYRNVAFPRFFMNYKMNTVEEVVKSYSVTGYGDRTPIQSVTSMYVGSTHELNQVNESWYVDGKFYTYMYGIPYFLVESEINCNERLKGVEPHEQFYPAIGDYMEWTQQKNVPINIDNTFMISPIFQSKYALEYKVLPETYESKFWNCAAQKPNGVIWSRKDVSENSLTDPWLFFKPLDFYEFPAKFGDLVHLKGIESEIILGRFTNQVSLFNTIDIIRERTDADLSSGNLFAGRSMDYNHTDLGYSGSQSTEMISCEFGHFWVDAKRGQVFMVKPNGEGLQPLHPGMSHWLEEHLPFKILRSNIYNRNRGDSMTYEDVDNKFSGLGLSLGWDNRFKRVFVTKKDYIPVLEPSGYVFDNSEFYYHGNKVQLTDPKYFTDVSFTLAFSCKNNNWISYYSFTPDFYVEHQHYFQTGKNFAYDSNEIGLWSHLLTAQSYQVFYGKRYPFMLELPVREQYVHKILMNIQYRMEARRYHSEIDWAVHRTTGFNKAWVYNDRNNSGLLNLIPEEKNDMYQKVNYPRVDGDSTSILATEVDDRWSINDFFNRVKDDQNNVPLWVKDANDINKEVNGDAIYFDSVWLDRLRGDWFLVRYSNDQESRFKMMFRWASNEEKIYR